MEQHSSKRDHDVPSPAVTRRSALKKTTGLLGTVTMGAAANTATAEYMRPPGGSSPDPVKTWADWEDDTYEDFNFKYWGLLSGAVDYYGAQELETGEWVHTFHASSTSLMYRKETYTNDSYSQHDDIYRTNIRIESNDTDRQWIAASKFNTDIGVTPAPSPDDNSGDIGYGSALYSVISTALGELNDKVNVAATAFEVIDALTPEHEAPEDSEDIKEFAWPYDFGNEAAVVHNYAQFLIVNNDFHSETDFDIYFEANSGGDSVINLDRYRGQAVNFTISVDANDYN